MTLNKNKHKINIEKILLSIMNSKIWDYLAFKWWTLVYLKYWLDRFSTDLDFDLINEIPDNEIVSFIDEMFDILNQYWTVKDHYNKYNTIFFLLSYWLWEMAIKVEINKRIWKSNQYEQSIILWQSMNIMSLYSIIWNKLVAITDRNNPVNRDLYDINFFLKNYNINNKNVKDLIKERTEKDFLPYLQYLIKFIFKNYSERTILWWLWEVIDEKLKQRIKVKLIPETLELLNKLINSLS